MASGDDWLLRVRGHGGTDHLVMCPRALVLIETDEDWVPVAICAKDQPRNLVLVELPARSGAVNRLWVEAQDVREDHTEVFDEKTTIFPIVRVHMTAKKTGWDERIKVVKIVDTAEAAQMESDRLNLLNGANGSIYFWQALDLSKEHQNG